MLIRILKSLSEGGSGTIREFSDRIGLDEKLLTVMLQELCQKGYLVQGNCGSASCSGCTGCTLQSASWSLTEKG